MFKLLLGRVFSQVCGSEPKSKGVSLRDNQLLMYVLFGDF
jgi:hypothetical protein